MAEKGYVPSPSQKFVNSGSIGGGAGGLAGASRAGGTAIANIMSGRVPVPSMGGGMQNVRVPRAVEDVVWKAMLNPTFRKIWVNGWSAVQNPRVQIAVSPYVRAGVERNIDSVVPDSVTSFVKDRF